jgi:hypothetical protein
MRLIYDSYISDPKTRAEETKLPSNPKKPRQAKKQAKVDVEAQRRLELIVKQVKQKSLEIECDPNMLFQYREPSNCEETAEAIASTDSCHGDSNKLAEALRIVYKDANLEFDIEDGEVSVYATQTIPEDTFVHSLFGELTTNSTDWPIKFSPGSSPHEALYIQPRRHCLLPLLKTTSDGNLYKGTYVVSSCQIRESHPDNRLFRARVSAMTRQAVEVQQGDRVKLNWKDAPVVELPLDEFYYERELSQEEDGGTPSTPPTDLSDDENPEIPQESMTFDN